MRANAGSFCIVTTITDVSGEDSIICGISSRLGEPGMLRSRTRIGRLVAEHVAGGGLGVRGLGHDLDVGLGLEDHADPVADQLVVVGEDDRDLLSV